MPIPESLRPFAAYILNRTDDVLAANPAARALFPGMEEWPSHRRNVARYLFLHPAARALFPEDWETQARRCAAGLRAMAGTDPGLPELAALVEELEEQSPDFARMWARYDVRGHTPRTETVHHPLVGRVTLDFQAMMLEDTPGHRLSVFYAAPETSAHRALMLLDSSMSGTAPAP